MLAGRVRFTDDETDENAVSSGLLNDLIDDAECDVEMRLSVRYEVPFICETGEGFDSLPSTTKNQIKALVRMYASRRVLDTDFGKGTTVNSEEYQKELKKDYEERIERLIERREGTFSSFKYPPLKNMRLAAGNYEADDGYPGTVMVTSEGYGNYAAPQINSPGETMWNGTLKDID